MTLTGEQFLTASPDVRRQELDRLGLLRYSKFLVPMVLSEANSICVERFLKTPAQVKFPQMHGADMSGLLLDTVNFIRADLSGANLSDSSLRDANLLFAKAIAADLRGADLRGTSLSLTNWTDALVEGCRFGLGNGLTPVQVKQLRDRGALFDL